MPYNMQVYKNVHNIVNDHVCDVHEEGVLIAQVGLMVWLRLAGGVLLIKSAATKRNMRSNQMFVKLFEFRETNFSILCDIYGGE